MTSVPKIGMSVAPDPPTEVGHSSCSNCGAELASDQRYCLACGEPVSPTRLSFLDALPTGRTAPGAHLAGEAPSQAQARGSSGPLGRYAGLLSLLAVLLLAFVAGLLVGHWVTSSPRPVKEVVTVQGAAAAPPSTPSTTAPSSGATNNGNGSAQANGNGSTQGKGTGTHSSTTKSNSTTPTTGAKAKSTTQTTGKAQTTTPNSAAKTTPAQETTTTTPSTPTKPTKLSQQTKENLEHSTGKKYEEEINKTISSGGPIET